MASVLHTTPNPLRVSGDEIFVPQKPSNQDVITKRINYWLADSTVTEKVGEGRAGGNGYQEPSNNIYQTCPDSAYINELYITGGNGNVVKSITARCNDTAKTYLTSLGKYFTEEPKSIICDKGLVPNAAVGGAVIGALNFRCFNKDKDPTDISVGGGDSGGVVQWYTGSPAKPNDITATIAGCPDNNVINGYGGEFGTEKDQVLGSIQFKCIPKPL